MNYITNTNNKAKGLDLNTRETESFSQQTLPRNSVKSLRHGLCLPQCCSRPFVPPTTLHRRQFVRPYRPSSCGHRPGQPPLSTFFLFTLPHPPLLPCPKLSTSLIYLPLSFHFPHSGFQSGSSQGLLAWLYCGSCEMPRPSRQSVLDHARVEID